MSNKDKGNLIIAFLGALFLIILFVIKIIKLLILPLMIAGSIFLLAYLFYELYCRYYFTSSKFNNLKYGIQGYITNCNELNNHILELKRSFIDISPYDYGIGEINDVSFHNFKRSHWINNIKSHQTYNCSLTVCKNANNQPIKYLCKYFNIELNEKSLSNFESVLNDFAAAEQGKILLLKERDQII